MQAKDPPWLLSPGQTSLEVQNRDIGGPIKSTYALQKKLKRRGAIQRDQINLILVSIYSRTATSFAAFFIEFFFSVRQIR